MKVLLIFVDTSVDDNVAPFLFFPVFPPFFVLRFCDDGPGLLFSLFAGPWAWMMITAVYVALLQPVEYL